MLAGGNWNEGVNTGSRTVNLNNYPWNANTNIGCRLACEVSTPKSRLITVGRAVTQNAPGFTLSNRQIGPLAVPRWNAELEWRSPCGGLCAFCVKGRPR